MATKAKKLDKYSQLQEILTKELPINAARVKFIVLLIIALIKVQSVNFEKLAQGFDNAVALSSNLRRIQRFFAFFALPSELISRLLFKMLPVQAQYGLTLDRTNWKFGQININILVLGVIYRGVSFPLLWSFLGDKRGNSDQQERIALVQRFMDLFGLEKIDFLTADREFVVELWWQFLIAHKIRFFIRLRENMQVNTQKGRVKAYWLLNHLALHTAYTYPKIVQIRGNWVYLSGLKFLNKKGTIEFLIVASFAKSEEVLDFYRQRWQIETMFRAFKSAGFDIEASHLRQYDRLDKLLMLKALAFVWAYRTGLYTHQHTKALKIKKHGRLEKSFFAYGLETLAFVLLNNFANQIELISSTFLSGT